MRTNLLALTLACTLGTPACADDGDLGSVITTPLDGDETSGDTLATTSATTPVLAQMAGTQVCRDKQGKHRGKTVHTLQLPGGPRSFVYYAPPNLDPNKPAPIVIVPHGFVMNGEMMYNITQYHQLADREGFVVFYPDAALGVVPWNVGPGLLCGMGAVFPGINADQAFVDAMVKFAEDDRCVDNDHVFMTGFSMGGYFSNETGCRNPKVKAIAPHSGGTHELQGCLPRKMPVMIMHYDSDTLIGYDCGVDSRNKWVRQNGCEASSPRVEPLPQGKCEYYRNCKNGQVAMCSFKQPPQGGELIMGHGWAGGARPAGASGGSFSINGPSSATEISWNFFKQYAW